MSSSERAHQFYLEGNKIIETDRAAGIKLLTDAAELGSADAAYMLHAAYFMLEQYRDNPEYIARGFALLRQAVDAGLVAAVAQYGLYLITGQFGITHDVEKGYKLINFAAEKGNNLARVMLGTFYRDGIVVTQDFTKMVHYLELAAAENDFVANCCLGDIYADGMGVELDPARALPYYLKSAQAGYAPAKIGYARVVLNSNDCTEELAAPYIEMLQSLAEQKEDQAMLVLGAVYAHGLQVKKDIAKGKALLEQAVALGNKRAAMELKAVQG